MDQFDMQLMLPDGSFADYTVKAERNSDEYKVFKDDNLLVAFIARENGEWDISDNPGNIDSDLESRMKEQLKGFRT